MFVKKLAKEIMYETGFLIDEDENAWTVKGMHFSPAVKKSLSGTWKYPKDKWILE